MEHHMGEEKIEQNAERLRNFLFHILGCGKEDARKIIDKFIGRYLNNKIEKRSNMQEEKNL